MIPEIGHFALILALCVAVVQGSLPIYGAAVGSSTLMSVAKPAARGQFLLVLLAFCCLGYAFAAKDFSHQSREDSYLPTQRGMRFSRKAWTPSRASSVFISSSR